MKPTNPLQADTINALVHQLKSVRDRAAAREFPTGYTSGDECFSGSLKSRLLFLTDLNGGRKYLIDAGAEVSVLRGSSVDRHMLPLLHFQAVKQPFVPPPAPL